MEISNCKVFKNAIIFFLFSILFFMALFQNVIALDSDNNGLADDEEIQFRTNPNDADSDDDGVLDGDEIDWNKDTDAMGELLDINALDPDSDGDGIYDGTEMGITTPHNDTDLSKDFFIPDTDGGEETTSMVDRDTDDDCLGDGEEDRNKNGKYEPLLGETDPNFPDTDGDGIPNYEDIDSDGDGMDNVFEDLFGLSNCDPNDADDDDDGDGFTNLREYLGDDNNPGNNDWSDPTDPRSTPDLAPKVEFSRPQIKAEINQTITIDRMILIVSDSDKDLEIGLTYNWDWGDNKKETETGIHRPSEHIKNHTYERAGTYFLTLRVVDPHRNEGEDTLEMMITVASTPPLKPEINTTAPDDDSANIEDTSFYQIFLVLIIIIIIVVITVIFVIYRLSNTSGVGDVKTPFIPEYRVVPADMKRPDGLIRYPQQSSPTPQPPPQPPLMAETVQEYIPKPTNLDSIPQPATSYPNQQPISVTNHQLNSPPLGYPPKTRPPNIY